MCSLSSKFLFARKDRGKRKPIVIQIQIQIIKNCYARTARANLEMNLRRADGQKQTRMAPRPILRERKGINRDHVGIVNAKRGRNIECK
jgi:hypothetical protein